MNKKLLTVAIAGAVAAPMTAQAVDYKISGQVNRAVVFSDDGVQSDVRNVDSNASGTRFRFVGSEDLGNGMKVGMYYELQTTSAGSGQSPDEDSARNADGIGIRYANVWFSGNWGKLTIGQGDGAGNGAAEADLSGTSIATAPARNSYTGGLVWRPSSAAADLAAGGNTSGFTESDTYNGYDGFSRYDVLRYDTPALGPVVLTANIGNDQIWEAAARLNSAVGGGELSAALFYGHDTGVGNVDGQYGGSLAFMFSQGTSIQGHWAKREDDRRGVADGKSWHVKLGHKWGAHAVSAQYYSGDDVTPGFEDTGWSLGYVHTLKKANAELYGAFHHAELDDKRAAAVRTNYEDHNAVIFGARVKFN